MAIVRRPAPELDGEGSGRRPGVGGETHRVANQAPPLAPYDVFAADLPLAEAVEREGGGWGVDRLRDTGALAGSPEAIEHSERAERNEPRLCTHDRYGHRVDEVELDPSWHWLLRQAVEREIHSLPWREPGAGAHVVRAALMFLWSQVNSGVMCPVSMTYSAIPALRANPDLAAEWEPQRHARSLVEDLALGLQASLLVRHAPPAAADAFCASRLGGEGGRAFGTLGAGVDAEAILERALAG